MGCETVEDRGAAARALGCGAGRGTHGPAHRGLHAELHAEEVCLPQARLRSPRRLDPSRRAGAADYRPWRRRRDRERCGLGQDVETQRTRRTFGVRKRGGEETDGAVSVTPYFVIAATEDPEFVYM